MKNRVNDVQHESISFGSISLNLDIIPILYHFITERYNIRLRRLNGDSYPWTKDEILRDYSFTNVRREHDRVSSWLINNISLNGKYNDVEKFYLTFIFRLYNRIDIGEVLCLGDGELKSFYNYCELLKNGNIVSTYNKAFKMASINKVLKNQYPKIDHKYRILYYVPNAHNIARNSGLFCMNGNFNPMISAESIYNYFLGFPGLGRFMAYQLFVDTTYIPSCPVSENEFVVAGPGCIRGLNRLVKDYNGYSHEDALFYLTDHLEHLFSLYVDKSVFKTCNEIFIDLPEEERKFNVMSMENIFCEFGKYCYKKLDLNGFIKRKYIYNED